MKKTIIALLALGSASMVAQADESAALKLKDATIISSAAGEMNIDASGMADNTAFTLTMNLNPDKLIETISLSAPTETNTWIAKIDTDRSGSHSDYYTGLAVVYASSTNETDASLMAGYYNEYGKHVGKNFNVTDGTTTITYLSSIVSSAWGYDAQTKTSTIEKAAVTISGNVGSEFTILLTMEKEDGTRLEYNGATSGYSFSNTIDINSISFDSDIVNSAYFFDSVVAAENIKTLNAEALNVPEPTTITLSLLSLAGLAARRRRK